MAGTLDDALAAGAAISIGKPHDIIEMRAPMAPSLKDPETNRLAREVARLTGERLLFKGGDFARTNAAAAIEC
jgi:hypothetical protein